MPEYVWIYDNRQNSEYVSYNTQCKVTLQVNDPYWEMVALRTLSKIYDGALWKTNYSFYLFLQSKPS